MRTKALLVVLLLLIARTSVMGQSASETLKYINEIVNNEASQVTKMQGQKLIWKVSTDGLLTVKLIHRDGYTLDTRAFYLKSLCNNMSCTKIESIPEYGSDGPPIIFLRIKSDSGKELRITMADEASANRAKNAIFHLVTLAKANKVYKGKDPFDY